MLLIHKIISRYAVLVKSYKPLNVFIGKAKLAKKYQTGVEICEKYKKVNKIITNQPCVLLVNCLETPTAI